ncbi:MAG: ABC transporter substrate-binding protein [Oscillospiraceae bacterium]|nr:ABC transporter substrate-binding protein [Oscillospiraceae bacterium]
MSRFKAETEVVKVRRRNRVGTALVALCIIALSLCSCANPFRAKSRAPEGGGTYGGEVVVGITQEPGIFDPHTSVAAGDEEILFNIFEGLVKCLPSGEFAPALATDYVISDDATIYTFTLRTGVVFHNGEPMTAEDVVYSISRAAGLETGVPLRDDLSGILSVEATSTNSIRIVLESPDAELLPFLAVAIIPRSVADINETPIGTGPFKFQEYRVCESVILVRNNNYWQSGLPYLDRVTFKITPDMNTAFLQLRSGSIDIFPYLDSEKASRIESDYQILSGESNMIHLLALNNVVAPFDNPKVREAMNRAIDRTELIQILMDGAGTPIYSGLSPAMGAYYNESLNNAFPYDPERAVELLTEAGYPDGFRATLVVPSNYRHHINAATILVDQFSRVGIHLSVLTVDWATWLSSVYAARDFETTVIALTSDFSPRDVLSRYVSDAGNNFINYSNPEFDAVFDQIRGEPDEDERILLYHRLQEILAEDSASVYFEDPRNIVAVSKDLSGYVVYPIYVQDMSTVHYN